MRKLILLLTLLALPAFGAVTYVNSIRCGAVNTCTTSWNVTAGNVLIVGSWNTVAIGTISDTQSLSYASPLRNHATYDSYSKLWANVLVSGGAPITVNSTATEGNILIAEFSGVSTTLDASDNYTSDNGGHVTCPPSAPLSVTSTTDDLLVSLWGEEPGGTAATCTASSGTLLGTSVCSYGQPTGQMDYQIVTAGTWTQQFTFDPTWNTGPENCGIYALKATVVGGGTFPNGYSYCKVVTTAHGMVSGTSDLTNYPLTAILTDANLAVTGSGGHVQNSNGYDIVFDDSTSCSGAGTALSWEMESYAPTTGAIVAHLKRPTLSHTADDLVSMYYGKSGVSTFQSTASSVWDYKGVWHLPNGTTLSGADSTTNATTLTGTSGNLTATAGKMDGGGANDPASTTELYAGFVTGEDGSDQTAETWFKTSASGAMQDLIRRDGGGGGGRNWLLRVDSSNKLSVVLIWGGNPGITSSASVNDGAWHHAALVFSASGGNTAATLYLDGASVGTNTASGLQPSTGQLTDIGRMWSGSISEVFNGSLDEVRLSATARSADWILTEYRNQSAPGTYLSEGAELTSGAAPVYRRRSYGQ